MRPMLAFDTSTPCARVAVLAPEGDCLATAEKVAARHSSNLLRLCDEVLRATGVTVSDLAAIACGAGPGSFTGLRVGLAVAKGLALADQIPLVLVSSLDALAADLAEVSSWEPSKGSQTLRPPTSSPTPLASLGLARWCAAGDEGAREARGAGRVVVRPEAPVGGAGGLPTRLNPQRGLQIGQPANQLFDAPSAAGVTRTPLDAEHVLTAGFARPGHPTDEGHGHFSARGRDFQHHPLLDGHGGG